MLEFQIKSAITEYMREQGSTKREAIFAVNEIIKKLAEECKQEETPTCYSCGCWDADREQCLAYADYMSYGCNLNRKWV